MRGISHSDMRRECPRHGITEQPSTQTPRYYYGCIVARFAFVFGFRNCFVWRPKWECMRLAKSVAIQVYNALILLLLVSPHFWIVFIYSLCLVHSSVLMKCDILFRCVVCFGCVLNGWSSIPLICNMLEGNQIRWLWLVSVDLLTSTGNEIAQPIFNIIVDTTNAKRFCFCFNFSGPF